MECLVTFRGALFQLSLGIVSLGCAQSKLVPEILQRAVTGRAHLWTSSGPAFRADHSVFGTVHHRLSVGTIGGVSVHGQSPLATLSGHSGPRP